MNFTRTPFSPVNRSFTPQNLPDTTLDRILLQRKTQNQLKKLGAPSTQFCKAVDSIVANTLLPPQFNHDWVCFLRLALEVMSANNVRNQCRVSFHTFLSVADTLPPHACKSMASALIFYKSPDPLVQSLVRQLNEALGRVYLKEQQRKLNEQEAQILQKVTFLQRATAVPLQKPNARYPADQFTDLPDMQTFLQSDDVETRIYGFNGIADARRELKALAPRLPDGSMYEALGKGKKAYIVIEKPCWTKNRDWEDYCDNKVALDKARNELRTIQADIRRTELDSTVTASKKRRTE